MKKNLLTIYLIMEISPEDGEDFFNEQVIFSEKEALLIAKHLNAKKTNKTYYPQAFIQTVKQETKNDSTKNAK